MNFNSSYSKQKNAELRPAVIIRIQHVKCLRVTAAHNSLKPSPHVQQLPLRRAHLPPVLHHWNHAGTHRHALHGGQHVPIQPPARPGSCVATLPPIAIHSPHGLVEQPPGPALSGLNRSGFLTLERDPDQTGCHLLDEGGRWHGEL